ncbi:LacI family DNA-binding transcriptional regulator [soil metagenome]
MTATDRTARTAHRGASMGDVAKVAGVSGQTVSRVVNGHTNVDDATRRRVLAAMDAVGYRPNRAARALRSGRFRTIGVIMFTLSSFGNMRTLDAIAMAATEADYAITLLPVAHPTQGDITGALSRLSEQAVDGVVILIEAHMLDQIDIVLPPGVPAVVIDSSADYPFPIVDTDQAEGARFATEHLLELGHKTVWHIAGPVDSYSAGRRLDSWRATLEAHKAPVPEPLVGDWSSEAGYTLGRTLAANPEVTAIFTANDQMALGVLRALHESGRAVPGEVSVVGFDDMDEAASFWPPLTTVRQDFTRVGKHTVAALLAEIDGRPVPTHLDVPTTLVIRESSAPPPR